MTLRQLLSSDYVTGLVTNNMDSLDQMGRSLMGSVSSTMSTIFSITMNMYEKDNQYHYELEIPGIEKENVQLQQTEGFIKVSGVRKFRNEVQKENYHTIESSYGKFERKFRLPIEADPKTIDAKFKNGMLLLKVNKISDSDESMNSIDIK
jgi:HSP20 family protein